jgi:hypothetical protein
MAGAFISWLSAERIHTMSDPVCADVRRWLQRSVLLSDLTPPAPALCAHVAMCPVCRGALAVLAVEALGWAAPVEINCQQSARDLAAFIEQEAEEGSAAAIRSQPQIWWHLWTCEACAETYRITRSLMQPEQPDLPAAPSMFVPQFGATALRKAALKLPRYFLHQALAPSPPAMGPTRGSAGLRNVLAENESAEQHLTVSVQRQTNGEWRVDVSVKPPPVGWLLLTLGPTHFRSHFDVQGDAIIRDVPFSLLTASDGPDLEIDVELDA